MNWIICPVRNSLDLTLAAYKSFYAQDIGKVQVLTILSNPTPQIENWSYKSLINSPVISLKGPTSVAQAWNKGIDWVLGAQNEEHVLVCNNDIELLPETYRLLVEDGGQFVTAVSVNSRDQLTYELGEKRPHPDFSCFLIRKKAWHAVRPFDENFKVAYCEDHDFHCRLHELNIPAYCLNLPMLHHRSSTLKSASEEEREEIQKQADLNRAYFKEKYGFEVGSVEFYNFFRGKK